MTSVIQLLVYLLTRPLVSNVAPIILSMKHPRIPQSAGMRNCAFRVPNITRYPTSENVIDAIADTIVPLIDTPPSVPGGTRLKFVMSQTFESFIPSSLAAVSAAATAIVAIKATDMMSV